MKISFDRVREAVLRPIPSVIVICGLAAILLLVKITSLVPFGEHEQANSIGSANTDQIKNDILFAPLKGFQLFILKFTENDTFIRLAAVGAALVSAYFLFILLQKWFTPRVSVIASLMYITSSLFLHSGRSSNTEVLYLCVIPIILVICLWFLSKYHDNKLPLAAILMAILLYVPGTIIFLLGGIVVFRKYIFKNFRKIPFKYTSISIILFFATLAPLIYSFILKPSQVSRWFGIDTTQPLSVGHFASNFVAIPDQLFARGFDTPEKWLTGSPILDVFGIAMLILGIYSYRVGLYPFREKIIFTLLGTIILLIGLGNVVTIHLLIPLVFILIANGIAYMLQSWFTVFPRNPLARTVGIIILVAVVSLSCIYQLHRYYVAWPNAPKTKQALNSTE